jgi:Mg2+/Co2+ transporter CorB
VFRFHGFRFEVAGRDANRITLVRVRPLRQEPLNNSSTS